MTNHPDKGKKDGRCNVTACQAPLAGRMQGWMVNHTVTNGRLYYCDRCSRNFNRSDEQYREPRRITWDETTGPRIAGIHEDHPVYGAEDPDYITDQADHDYPYSLEGRHFYVVPDSHQHQLAPHYMKQKGRGRLYGQPKKRKLI